MDSAIIKLNVATGSRSILIRFKRVGEQWSMHGHRRPIFALTQSLNSPVLASAEDGPSATVEITMEFI